MARNGHYVLMFCTTSFLKHNIIFDTNKGIWDNLWRQIHYVLISTQYSLPMKRSRLGSHTLYIIFFLFFCVFFVFFRWNSERYSLSHYHHTDHLVKAFLRKLVLQLSCLFRWCPLLQMMPESGSLTRICALGAWAILTEDTSFHTACRPFSFYHSIFLHSVVHLQLSWG